MHMQVPHLGALVDTYSLWLSTRNAFLLWAVLGCRPPLHVAAPFQLFALWRITRADFCSAPVCAGAGLRMRRSWTGRLRAGDGLPPQGGELRLLQAGASAPRGSPNVMGARCSKARPCFLSSPFPSHLPCPPSWCAGAPAPRHGAAHGRGAHRAQFFPRHAGRRRALLPADPSRCAGRAQAPRAAGWLACAHARLVGRDASAHAGPGGEGLAGTS